MSNPGKSESILILFRYNLLMKCYINYEIQCIAEQASTCTSPEQIVHASSKQKNTIVCLKVVIVQ